MPRFLRCLTFVGLAALAGGCNFWLAGHTEDYTLIVHGQGFIDTQNETSTFTFAVDGSDLKCTGATTIVHKTGNIIGDRAAAQVTCSDGRKGTGEVVITSFEGGTGTGTDECGNKLDFVWNINEHVIQRRLAAIRQTAVARKASFADKCDAAGDAPPHRDPLI